MTRERKIARARELREQGLSERQIAVEVGVTKSCVHKWLNPEATRERARRDNAKRAAKKRAWENEHDRQPCPRCGRMMRVGARRMGVQSCRRCWAHDEQAKSHATFSRLERLWNEGKRSAEIQMEFGWSKGTVSVMVNRARERGYDLPYRRTGEALENIRRANCKVAA